VKFWDSSALVPLILAQPRTAAARAALEEDPEIAAWWVSSIECASAIARLHRDTHLSAAEEARARSLLTALRRSWFEVQPGDAVRNHALRLLRVHPLRAADALQLAAAIEWAGTPEGSAFVTFDGRLRDAARREGFEVAP
jgi:uncharacterized protein